MANGNAKQFIGSKFVQQEMISIRSWKYFYVGSVTRSEQKLVAWLTIELYRKKVELIIKSHGVNGIE